MQVPQKGDGFEDAGADRRCSIGVRFALKGIRRNIRQLDGVTQVSIAAALSSAKEDEEKSAKVIYLED